MEKKTIRQYIRIEVTRDDLAGMYMLLKDLKVMHITRKGLLTDLRDHIIENGTDGFDGRCLNGKVLYDAEVAWGDDMEGNKPYKRLLKRAYAFVDQHWPELREESNG